MNDAEKHELAKRFRERVAPFVKRHTALLPQEQSDAVLRQFTPDAEELCYAEGFSDDPLHEEDADIHPFADVVHKYPNKILYLTTDECPVYCRYCTRKRKTLLSAGHDATPLEKIVEYLRARPKIHEVIFSGGDPLMLPVHDLLHRMGVFLSMDSIREVRIHTRAVTTAPNLISVKFLNRLKTLREKFPSKGIAFVLHINTAAEISIKATQKITALRALKIPSYAQSVLLKGINDDAAILAALCRALIYADVQPYYLHQLDRVTGAQHFEVDDGRAKKIYNELKNLVPPYMLPRLMRDSKQGKHNL